MFDRGCIIPKGTWRTPQYNYRCEHKDLPSDFYCVLVVFFLPLFLSRRLISLPYSCRITSLKSCLGQNSKWSVSSCFRDYFIFLCAPTSSCVLWHSMSHYPSQAATFCCLHSAFHRGHERTIAAQLHVVIAFLTLNPTILYTLCWPVA